MSTTVHAYAVTKAGGRLEPFEYELGPLGPSEVDLTVKSCGICFSDVSMMDNAWGFTPYPLVPGHEIIGEVRALGEQVRHLSIGDVVGMGWHAGYCMGCAQCMGGDHHMCAQAASTFIGRHGGYADIVRAHSAAVFKLPKGVDARTAGPLMCGGITVVSPLLQHRILPTASVGVIGVGGLGHMAIKFARAWGCHVTAFTSTEAKQREALEMGAHEALGSNDAKAIAGAAERFDLLLSTVNVPMDWNAYVGTLKRRGRMHVLGAVMEPLSIVAPSLMMKHRSISSSPAGSPSDILQMLEFAGRHSIAPVTEHFGFDRVNDAIEHLRSGKARYRVVLDRASA
ncbi:MAG: NAD(P)-dependent alcohol dehydrogenase [Polyangiaceae bacterium]